nr:hypothetical protein [uncultured Desulfobacter sp.]
MAPSIPKDDYRRIWNTKGKSAPRFCRFFPRGKAPAVPDLL